LYTRTVTFDLIRSGTRSQWRLMRASETWSERRKLKISRAAALRTDCKPNWKPNCKIDREAYQGAVAIVKSRIY